jgi:uncharacterized protein YhjY with autotransporter beta-barrel domain
MVTGDFTAGGTVNLAFVGPVKARNQAYALISSQGQVLDDALQLGSHALPAAMTVDLVLRDGAAWLDLVPDFSLSGLALNGNLGALGRHLNAIVEKGPGGAMQSFLDGVMLVASDDGVNTILDQLQPTSFSALPAASIAAQSRFNDALLSCRPLDGEWRFNGESDCVWVRVATWDYDRDETTAAHGFEQQTFEMSTGVQKGVGEGGRWYLGMGVSVEDSSTEAGPWIASDGSLAQVGGVLKGVFGPASLAMSASAGSGRHDTRRRVPYLGEFAVARSEQDLTLYSADLRVSYDFAGAQGYLRPMLDVDYANLRFDGFRERGAGPVNLVVGESSDDYVALRPALEAGWEWQLDGGSKLRPYARVGTTHVLEGETRVVSARFEGTPAGVAPFVSQVEGEDTYTDVAVGCDWLREKGPSVRFGYFGQFASETDLNSVSLKVWMPF